MPPKKDAAKGSKGKGGGGGEEKGEVLLFPIKNKC